MKVRTRAATALLMMSAAVAACGGASASSPIAQGQASAATQSSAAAGPVASQEPGTATNACALITESEATSVLGSDPGPGIDSGTADAPACAYGASLTVVVESTDAKAQYDARKAAMQGSGKGQDLTGVGDAGFVFIVANTIAQMEILKGSVLLTVNVQGDPSRQNITVDALTGLGTTVAARL